MKFKQLKLSNTEEIICEILETEDDGYNEVVVKNCLKVMAAEDYENNVRYYSFRPWIAFQDDLELLSTIKLQHIVAESNPSPALLKHYKHALSEVTEGTALRRELNLDEFMLENSDLSADEIEDYIEEKMMEKNENERFQQFEQDSATPNIINFKPKGSIH